MSIINEMLRELDRRGVPAERAAVPAAVAGLPPADTRLPKRLILAGLLLAAGAAAFYWTASGGAPGTAPVRLGAETQRAAAATSAASASAGAAAAAPAPALARARVPAVVTTPVSAPHVPPRRAAAAPLGAPVLGSSASLARPPELARATQAPPAAVSAQPGLQPATRDLPAGAPPSPAAANAGGSGPLEMAARVAPPSAASDAPVRKVDVTPEAEAQRLYDEAEALRRAERLGEARELYRQALARNPALVGARLQLARIMQESGEANAALTLLQSGYAQRADALLAIAAGRLLGERGEREQALQWLGRGEDALRPADHALRGALLSQLGRPAEATPEYQRALASDPQQGGWLLGLGLALEAQGRTEEARAAYRTALARGGFKPEVMRFLRERAGDEHP